MAVVRATGTPTAQDAAYYRDAGELREAAKQAALKDLAYKLQRYASFSYSEVDGKTICSATLVLSDEALTGHAIHGDGAGRDVSR